MLRKKITECEFTIVDVETTGLTPYKGAKLVEIGAVKLEKNLSLRLDKGFSTLINPEVSIPYSAYKIHKISDEMVKDAPKVHEVLPKFTEYVKDTVFVAHNAKFDFRFIDYFYKEYKMCCPLISVVDTLLIAKRLVPGLESYSLDNLIKYFDVRIPFKNSYRHRAIFDAVHTAVIFKKLMLIAIEKFGEVELVDIVYN